MFRLRHRAVQGYLLRRGECRGAARSGGGRHTRTRICGLQALYDARGHRGRRAAGLHGHRRRRRRPRRWSATRNAPTPTRRTASRSAPSERRGWRARPPSANRSHATSIRSASCGFRTARQGSTTTAGRSAPRRADAAAGWESRSTRRCANRSCAVSARNFTRRWKLPKNLSDNNKIQMKKYCLTYMAAIAALGITQRRRPNANRFAAHRILSPRRLRP